jgi:hypothetical protein
MENRKINIDRTKPSSEEILSRRNFDALMQQYTAAVGGAKVIKPLWQKTWFLSSMAAAAVVAVIVMVIVSKSDATNVDPSLQNLVVNNNTPNTRIPDSMAVNYTPTKLAVAPPLKGFDVAFQSNQVNAKKGGTIEYASGTKIVVPAGAFVDENGNAITGNVDLQYREFRDQMDIFLAGIPMQYDSAGKQFSLESAGMMEINAFVDGKVVRVNQNKPIEVQFASKKSGEGYNQYYFNKETGVWEYLGADHAEPMVAIGGSKPKPTAIPLTADEKATVKSLQQVRDQEIAAVNATVKVPEQPAQPVKANRQRNRFKVDFSIKEFPEMKVYQDVLWEVDETAKAFDRNYMYSNEWESVVVGKGTARGKYILTFTRKGESVSYDAYPVFEGKEYDSAVKTYEEKFAEYSEAITKKENAIKETQKKYETELAKAGIAPDMKRIVEMKQQEGSAKLAEQLIHTFNVSRLGIYNCDKIANFDGYASANISFWDEYGNVFANFSQLSVLDRSRAIVQYYYANPLAQMRYSTVASNLILAVKDGKLYTADQSEFEQLPKNGDGQMTLVEVKKNFANAEEMKVYFKIPTGTI